VKTHIESYDIEKDKSSQLFRRASPKRSQILLGHTSRDLDNYLKSTELRRNGKYTTIPHFVISKKGKIINLVKTHFITNLFGYNEIDKQNISIFLENEGWLTKITNQIKVCDWIGNIYNNKPIQKKWRNKLYWAPYTEKQVDALVGLVSKICDEFKINKNFVGHNVRVPGVEKFEGIVTRSNYSEYFTDLSPAFNFKKLEEIK